MKIKSCGVIPFIRSENLIKVLIIKHLDGHWSFPKGQKDPDESDLETAKREFSEETGITDFKIFEDKSFIEKYSFTRNDKKIEKEVVFFLAEVNNEGVKIQEEEVSEYSWLDYENTLKLLTHEETAQILMDAFNYLYKYRQL